MEYNAFITPSSRRFRFTRVILLIVLSVIFNSCLSGSHIDKDNYSISIINSNLKKNKDTVINVKKLDSLSLRIELPYGKKEIIDYDFPDHWYCGGGYLEGSLLQEGYTSKDSIDYAQAYFSIIHFNREDNLASQPENKSFNLKENIYKLNKILLKYDDIRIESLSNIATAFIVLPDINGKKVYGIVSSNKNLQFNPLYIVVKSGIILDALPIYAFSRSETMINKTCYIDENYIWHVKTFQNIDGFEVESGVNKQYKITDEGRFVRYYADNGWFDNNFEEGLVKNNTQVGKWKEFKYVEGYSKPTMLVESEYANGKRTGQWKIYSLKNQTKGKFLYFETYKDGEMIRREFVND